jgi:hypothetical protein
VSTVERRAGEIEGRVFRVPALGVKVDDAEREALAYVHGAFGHNSGSDIALSMTPGGVDLGRVRTPHGAPLFIDHIRSLSCMVGAVTDGWVEDDVLHLVCRFGVGSEADRWWSWLAAGFPIGVSAGVRVEHAEPRSDGRYLAARWELLELSLVPLGADKDDHVKAVTAEIDAASLARSNAASPRRLAVRQQLRLPDWEAWAAYAAVQLASRLGTDLDTTSEALTALVAERCRGLEEALV